MFYAKALFYDETNMDAHIGKAEAYKDLKQYSKSIQSINEALKIENDNENALFVAKRKSGKMEILCFSKKLT